MLLSSFLITFGLFFIIVFISCAIASDIPWLAIPAGVIVLMTVFGVIWWAIYTGMAS